METVVLRAQDHVARERYGQQVGDSSGIIYSLGCLPRTRKKVRSPHESFDAASLNPDTARSSDNNNVHVTDSSGGLACSMDMSVGVFRSAPSSALTSPLPPSSVLKRPQYTPHLFIPHELALKMLQQHHQVAPSVSTPAAVSNSMSNSPRQLFRTRSDGVLRESLQQQGLKRVVDNSKRVPEKGADSSKDSAEKTLRKIGEKQSDRRKGLDGRPVEKKPIALTVVSQGDTSNPVHMKASVVSILRRPQTKEAATENMALFTGKPIEGVTKPILKSALAMSQNVLKPTRMEVESVKGVELLRKDGESVSVRSRSLTNVSPKKRTKKKQPRDFTTKGTPRAAEVAQIELQRAEGAEPHGESRRPKIAPRRRSDIVELYSDEHEQVVDLDAFGEQDVDEMFKSLRRGLNSGHVSPSIVDDIVLNWSNNQVYKIPGVLNSGQRDSLVGVVRQGFARQGLVSRSGSFRDVSLCDDNGVEPFVSPSLPPDRSERWAGPAYTSSPPPSTLPLPTFPLQREKTLANVVLRESEDTILETVCSSIPLSPAGVASLLLAATMESPFVDPLSATKD